MSATATVNSFVLLTSLGLDAVRVNNAYRDVELVIDTFDVWQNSEISTEAPVMGCLCFRDPETEAVAA
ncbi:MAG TPA: hypothetical protein VFX16_31245 [Pseudonocardiaceae bacterium]|nr:hypothetical protein [Pseudonocardiaceae bacterium]